MALIDKARQGQIAKEILVTLKGNDGEMRGSEVVGALMESMKLTDVETHTYESGPSRFEVYLRFISSSLVKADFVRKSRGRWFLTSEGENHVDLPPSKLYEIVVNRYAAWDAARDPDETIEISAPQPDQEAEIRLNLETAEETAVGEIRDAVRGMGAYEFQDLVAALLRGMGYQTPFIAPKGPDGGTDVLAYLDPLGAKTPHIRVQVKHRQDKATNAEIASLLGNINPSREIGLFVASGGFTKEAERQMQRGQAHLELIDLDRFIDLWITHYPDLSDADKSMLPLRPVYYLAPTKK